MSHAGQPLDRRELAEKVLLAGGTAWMLGTAQRAMGAEAGSKPVRVAVIGCGSVSNSYLPVLAQSPHVQLISTCDRRPERARAQAERFHIRKHYPSLQDQLHGEPFDFLINLTDMQEHEALNRLALQAGKHVWSEKPIANSLAAGQELLQLALQKGLRLWGAPITVQSPQFAFMAEQLRAGKLGRVAAGQAHYGHEGPDWSAFFYERGGGSMPDLAVYNLTTLTGLLGPAKHVSAMLSVVTKTRQVQDKGEIAVEAEDNAMILMDHGDGVISHVQSGFNYFNPHGHDGSKESRYTVTVVGSGGFMGLVGYDWAPLAVDLATHDSPQITRHATDAQGYIWQQGAALAAESLVTGRELLVRPEHALHVLEIITAARQSQADGVRVPIVSTFPWPVVGS